ncbi:MAG TPA: hypothetical protein VFQ86_07800, partial [Arachidicoccus soli]|nr:hypothetical protein [Arachidicoccus soli]
SYCSNFFDKAKFSYFLKKDLVETLFVLAKREISTIKIAGNFLLDDLVFRCRFNNPSIMIY